MSTPGKASSKYHGPSPIWQYFNKVKQDGLFKGQCKDCGKILSLSGGSTSALRGHLKAHHPKDFLDVEAKTQELVREKESLELEVDDLRGAATSTPSTSRGAKRSADHDMKWRPNDPRQLNGDLAVMKLIAANNLPFGIVDTTGFRDFMSTFAPRFHVKHSTTFSK